jgi:hypothetical protein
MIGEKKGVRRRISTPRTSVRYPKKDYFVAGASAFFAAALAFVSAFVSAALAFVSAAVAAAFSTFAGSAGAAGAAWAAAIPDVQNRKTNAIAHTMKRFIFTTSSFHFFVSPLPIRRQSAISGICPELPSSQMKG